MILSALPLFSLSVGSWFVPATTAWAARIEVPLSLSMTARLCLGIIGIAVGEAGSRIERRSGKHQG